MQSLRSRRNSKRPLKLTGLAVLALLLIAGATTGGLYALKLGPFQSQSTSPTDDKKSTDDKSDESDTPVDIDEPAPADPSSESVKNPSSESDDGNDGGTGSDNLTITSAQVNGDALVIRTLITDVTQSGTCALSMTSSTGKTYAASAGVQAAASASTCKGFDVPVSSLGTGVWTIKITYSNNGKTSVATKEVVINA